MKLKQKQTSACCWCSLYICITFYSKNQKQAVARTFRVWELTFSLFQLLLLCLPPHTLQLCVFIFFCSRCCCCCQSLFLFSFTFLCIVYSTLFSIYFIRYYYLNMFVDFITSRALDRSFYCLFLYTCHVLFIYERICFANWILLNLINIWE